MVNNDSGWTLKEFITSFFPFHLLVAHIKFNLFALFFWAALFLFVADLLGAAFGVPFLFLSPEYLGDVSGWSFFFLGFAFGGFFMAFNTYSYIKLGPKFPFMTTLAKPFLKFCFNNSIIPATFVIFFIIRMSIFQANEEFASTTDIIIYNLTCLAGIGTFFIGSFLYFFPVTRRQERSSLAEEKEPIVSFTHREEDWFDQYAKEKDRTYIYFGKGLKLHKSRSIKHFNRVLIERTFAKNRINASVFEIITICTFFLLGLLNGRDFMEMPAGMSIVLLMTIILMLFSALKSWFSNWAYPILILVILSMNFLSSRTEMFNYRNYAYGLNYDVEESAPYTIERIKAFAENDSLKDESLQNYIKTLENWKAQTGEEKPKLVIINTSGGGSRSALWTLTVLQECDEELNGKLSEHIQFISGASGGMVGAAYYREILLRYRQKQITNMYDGEFRKDISKDMLNKLSFMATTNDIFIRYQKCHYNGHSYTKDRGYAFESQLNENTDRMMDHTLGYYRKFEESGTIPTMVFTPTIINDGRRLFIGSQPLNFLAHCDGGPNYLSTSGENIEFLSYFKEQDAENMRFSSVLRSSATFPFVMPMMTMPTNPQIQLMDAGIRDNYGGKTTMQFLHAMKDWIEKNTSGVIIVQIRDTKKILDNEHYQRFSFIDKLTMPFGNMYKNFPRVQDFDQEELVQIGSGGFDFPVDMITFNLRERKEDRISLSWHLTKQEKIKVEKAFQSARNTMSLERLKRIL